LDDLGNLDPTDDILRYKPLPGFVSPPADTFRYRIWDGTRISNYGTVTIDVVPLEPVAIDDTFDVSPGVTTDLDVLANDIEGVNGPLSVIAIGPRSAGGTVQNLGGAIRYTPPSPSFQGTDTFTYTVTDGANISQANVLVQVGGPTSSQIAQIEFRLYDGVNVLSENALVQQGDTITLAAFTRDRRGTVPDPDGILGDISGVISAYVDVLYNSSIATPVPASNIYGIEITFGPAYGAAFGHGIGPRAGGRYRRFHHPGNAWAIGHPVVHHQFQSRGRGGTPIFPQPGRSPRF
jgi:hypothetical protein